MPVPDDDFYESRFMVTKADDVLFAMGLGITSNCMLDDAFEYRLFFLLGNWSFSIGFFRF